MKKMTYILAFVLATAGSSVWAIPNKITYQGTLRDKGIPADSTTKNYKMTFRLTNGGPSAGFPTTVTYSDPLEINSVPVTNGLFSVQLNFTLAPTYSWDTITPYLNVNVNGQDLNNPEPINATAYSIVSNTVVDGAITAPKLAATLQQQLVPVGSVMAFAGTTPPAGWLLCDGAAVSRTQYGGLFTAIGTIWGSGNGTTTFNLPDLRGKSAIGAGQGIVQGTPLTNRTLGQSLGEESHTLSLAEMPTHNHGITDPGHGHTGNFQAIYAPGSGLAPSTNLAGGAHFTITDIALTGISINSTGSGAAHNNMQPSAAVNYIIKT